MQKKFEFLDNQYRENNLILYVLQFHEGENAIDGVQKICNNVFKVDV